MSESIEKKTKEHFETICETMLIDTNRLDELEN